MLGCNLCFVSKRYSREPECNQSVYGGLVYCMANSGSIRFLPSQAEINICATCPCRIPAAGLFSCLHFVDLNKMVDTDHFADVRKMVYQFRGDMNMIPTICVTSRKWSVRYALPQSCSSAPFPLPLPTETQIGSQGCFCAKEGHIQGCSR